MDLAIWVVWARRGCARRLLAVGMLAVGRGFATIDLGLLAVGLVLLAVGLGFAYSGGDHGLLVFLFFSFFLVLNVDGGVDIKIL